MILWYRVRMTKAWKLPTPDQLAHGWIQPDTSMRLCFAHYSWQVNFRPDGEMPKSVAQEAEWMGFAALVCSLVNLRMLDSFFTYNEPQRPGDMVAAWWPHTREPAPFLTDSERSRISRVVAHHTVDQMELAPHVWDVLGMVQRALERYAAFVGDICAAHITAGSPAAEVMQQRVQQHQARLADWKKRGVYSPEWRGE